MKIQSPLDYMDHENGGIVLPWNVGNYLQIDYAPLKRR